MNLTQNQIIDLQAISPRPGVYRWIPPEEDNDLRFLCENGLIIWNDGYEITENGREILRGMRDGERA